MAQIYQSEADLDISKFTAKIDALEARINKSASLINGYLTTIHSSFTRLASIQSPQQLIGGIQQLASSLQNASQTANNSANGITQAAQRQQQAVSKSYNQITQDAKVWGAELQANNAQAVADFDKKATEMRDIANKIRNATPAKLQQAAPIVADNVRQTAQEAEAATQRVIAAKQRLALAEANVSGAMNSGNQQLVTAYQRRVALAKDEVQQAIAANRIKQAEYSQAQRLQEVVFRREEQLVAEVAKQRKLTTQEQVVQLRYRVQVEKEAAEEAGKASLEATKRWSDRLLTLLKTRNAEELATLQKAAQERLAIEERSASQALAKRKQLQESIEKFRKAETGVGKNPMDTAAYRNAIVEAEAAEAAEKAAAQRRNQVMLALRKVEAQAAKVAYNEQIQAARAAEQVTGGMWNRITNIIAKAGDEIKKTENKFNSIFRAGSQISSVGTQMTMFGGSIIGVSTLLQQGAEDFDFWVRRAEASAISAGSVWQETTGTLRQSLQQMTFDLGGAVGATDFAKIAEGIYVYQSAAGQAINTTEDLQTVQRGLTAVFQAATITGDDYGNTTRGILQVMAEFNLGASEMERTMHVLMNTTQVTQAELPDMMEAFKYVGRTAHEMGLSVEEVAAVFGKLSDYGLKGSMAGRGFGMALEALITPSKKASTALDHLFQSTGRTTEGWRSVLQPGGEFISFLDKVNADGTKTKGVLTEMADALAGLSRAQQLEYINSIFAQNNAARQMVPLIMDQVRAQELANGTMAKALPTLQESRNAWAQMKDMGLDASAMVDTFASALMTVPTEERLAYLKDVFPDDPKAVNDIQRAAENLKKVELEARNSKKSVDELYAEFKNGGEQAKLFSKQWDVIGKSIKVEFGKEIGRIKEQFIKLGIAAAEVMLPILRSIGNIIEKIMNWAGANEETAKTIMKILGTLALVTVVIGPFLVALGAMMQGFSALMVIGTTVKQFFVSLKTLLFSVALLSGPAVLALVALGVALGALYIMWKTNWNGMRDTLDGVFNQMMNALRFFGRGFGYLLEGIFTGNSEKVQQGLMQMAAGAFQAFAQMSSGLVQFAAALPMFLAEGISRGFGKLWVLVYDWLSSMFKNAIASVQANMSVWGWNLIVTFVQGIWNSAVANIPRALTGIGNMIAGYFRGYSPPKVGPLTGIYRWGQNLIKTFTEGMTTGDISAVEEAADRIAGAIQDNFEAGGLGKLQWLDGVKLAHEKMLELQKAILDGKTVSESFFADLEPYLGRWYENIKNIALAYQNLAVIERTIKLEEAKLAVIKSQREELQKQYAMRDKEFEAAADPTGGDYYKAHEGEMVDPTTAAGKAIIAAKKASLSTEDFQTWIAFQRKLWDSKKKEEDRALEVQEDAIELALVGYKRQQAALKEAYDYQVKIYEYALKLANLDDADPTKKDAGGGGGGGAAEGMDDDASQADLDAARRRAREIAGEDQALKDEETLNNERGAIGAIGGADEQRDREAERIKDLDAANRKAKAEYDARKIAAKGNEEELAKIKREEEAWNTAYQEEKSRLQERKRTTDEVLDAAQEIADKTEPERIKEQKAKFEADISAAMGDQVEHISSAEEIKERTGDLDEAAKESQRQLREQERELADLRQLNDDKQLEFEERLKEAAGDEERIRKIKEEQDAWDLAYKKALEAQEARTRAAREADQDINDEQQADRQQGGGGGYAAMPASGFTPGAGAGAGIDIPIGGGGGKYDDPNKGSPDEDTAEKANPTFDTEPVDPWAKTRKDEQFKADQDALLPAATEIYTGTRNFAEGFKRGFLSIFNLQGLADLGGEMQTTGNALASGTLSIRTAVANPPSVKDFIEKALNIGEIKPDTFVGKIIDSLDMGLKAGVENWTPDQMADISDKMDYLQRVYGDEFIAKLMGPQGPYAISDYALAEVNGVWRRVLKDDAGNPTNISIESTAGISKAFFEAFTGDKAPDKITAEAMQQVGEAFYVRLTGEGSPPSTVNEMVRKVGDGMYELITGEKAPAKTSKEFIGEMEKIFKDLGIKGPVPQDVQAGMDMIGTAMLTKMSPTGEIPKNVDDAMLLLSGSVSSVMSGESSIGGKTKTAMQDILTAFNGLTVGDSSAVTATEAMSTQVKDRYGRLINDPDAPPAKTDEMLNKIKGFHAAMVEGDGTPGATTKSWLDAIKESYVKHHTGADSPKQTTDTALGAILIKMKTSLLGEEGVSSLFGQMTGELQTKSSIFGKNGLIAQLYGETANSITESARAAALAAARAAAGGGGDSNSGDSAGGHYAGLDIVDASPSTPVRKIVHGQEAILSYSNQDASTFRTAKKLGIWEPLKVALSSNTSLIRGDAIKRAITGQREIQVTAAKVSSPKQAERSIMPVDSPTTINKPVSINIERIDTRNGDESRRFLREMARLGNL